MSVWSDVVSTGFTKFWNAVISGGKFGIAMFIATITWVVTTLVAGIAAVVSSVTESIPTLASLLADLDQYGNAGSFGFWVWSYVGYCVAGYWAGLAICFLIRRIPFIGG